MDIINVNIQSHNKKIEHLIGSNTTYLYLLRIKSIVLVKPCIENVRYVIKYYC